MSTSLMGPDRYGIVAQLFHWAMAVLLLAQFAIGLYADDLPPGIERLIWMSWHKSLGLTLCVLMLARLAWRWVRPPPPLPENVPHWEQRVAHVTHLSIYALVVAAALVGWLSASARGLSVNWFGIYLVPDLVDKDKALGQVLSGTHQVLVYALAVLLAGHIAAALRHGLIRRDGVFSRMLPRIPGRRT